MTDEPKKSTVTPAEQWAGHLFVGKRDPNAPPPPPPIKKRRRRKGPQQDSGWPDKITE